MFLAWNEIKRNKLKFGLIVGILVLISYLLFLLSGLANGLINMNTEGIKNGKQMPLFLRKMRMKLFNNQYLKLLKSKTTLKKKHH